MKTLIIATALLSLTACSGVPEDKRMHAGGSFVIGLAAQGITEDVFQSYVICNTPGLFKEFYDEYKYGGFDPQDLLANFAGCSLSIWGVHWLQAYTDGDAVGFQVKKEF